MRRSVLCTILVACHGGDAGVAIEAVTPAFGPLSGGTRVAITGTGFVRDPASPNRVLFGGRESPQVDPIDATTLEVIVPAGEISGDAEITVFNRNGNATASGKFAYATPPTLASVSPANVLYSAAGVTITVTGTGFLDEDAGAPRLSIDGEVASDVVVTSDTELSFTAPVGFVMARPDLELTNARGLAILEDAYRYVPSVTPGLWVFPKDSTATFAMFYDPATDTLLDVPKRDTSTFQIGYRSLYTDVAGDAWAFSRDGRFGELDFEAQAIVDLRPLPDPNNRIVSTVRMGTTIFALRQGIERQFGTFDPRTRVFTTIAPSVCCNSYALATDGTTLYSIERDTIATIDAATGMRGTPQTLPASTEVAEMRFFDGVLYGLGGPRTATNRLLRIDPATGMTTVVRTFTGFRMSSLEVYQP